MRRVALSFDDGPSSGWTEAILDLLAEHNAKASFFAVGMCVGAREKTAMRIVRDGHDLGNHTYTHPRLTTLELDQVHDQLWKTIEMIAAITATRTSLWRAPYFAHNDRIDKIATDLQMSHVDCTIDPSDWAATDSELIASRVIGNLRDGSVVDLHDGIPFDGGTGTNTRQPTVDALRAILQTPNVTFVTVSSLRASA